LRIRDPESRAPLDPAGQWKTDNEFWRRLLRDGDVIEGAPPQEKRQPQQKRADRR
jgi:hypothetical protein